MLWFMPALGLSHTTYRVTHKEKRPRCVMHAALGVVVGSSFSRRVVHPHHCAPPASRRHIGTLLALSKTLSENCQIRPCRNLGSFQHPFRWRLMRNSRVWSRRNLFQNDRLSLPPQGKLTRRCLSVSMVCSFEIKIFGMVVGGLRTPCPPDGTNRVSPYWRQRPPVRVCPSVLATGCRGYC